MVPFIALVYIDDHTADAVNRQQAMTGGMAASGRIVGLFRWPERKDMHGKVSCDAGGKSAWVRDPEGFMKCQLCGKRNRRVRSFLINALFDYLGANRYDGAPAAFRTPEGYGPVRGQ